ncbi:protein [Saccharomycopsis crataegensis]|uniref:Protein n=1 Tax=Saccharomycopsis crataegensis TaxID=43959 RepID=A0AAV5QHJ5_9ASCO|nr:protein [Saccharomycopsis crataegensis]
MFANRFALGIRPVLRASSNITARKTVLKASLNTVSTTPNAEDEILIAQRKNRPVSPHLDIYQPQMTWYLSGLHRVTGVFLAAGFYGITCSYAAASLLGLNFDATVIYQTITDLPDLVKYAAKATIAFPFAFHFFNGLRHFVWDSGKELYIKGIYRTAYICLGLTAVAGTYLTFLS